MEPGCRCSCSPPPCSWCTEESFEESFPVCPWCGSEDLISNFRNNLQIEPHFCKWCGSEQFTGKELRNRNLEATAEELEKGWWKPPEFDKIPVSDLPGYQIEIEEIYVTDPMHQFAISIEEVKE